MFLSSIVFFDGQMVSKTYSEEEEMLWEIHSLHVVKSKDGVYVVCGFQT